ncbi:MAG: hypothetical protein ACRDRU_13440 [Pseudonocardiaceae bacterium]
MRTQPRIVSLLPPTIKIDHAVRSQLGGYGPIYDHPGVAGPPGQQHSVRVPPKLMRTS